MRDEHPRFSRTQAAMFAGGVGYGFWVGRRRTSLMKLCGACVRIMETAWATSSGCSIFFGSFVECGEKSVATEPGQMALTRMPNGRRSSAMHSVRPKSPHLEAQ